MLQNALPVNEIHKISMFSYQFEHTLELNYQNFSV